MASQQIDESPPEPDERPQRRREWTGALRSVILPLVAVGLIVLAVWYLEAGRGTGSSPAAGTGIVALPSAKNHTGKPAATDIGRAAPDFVLQKLGGGNLRLSDFQGKTVLINFWATWCGPCAQEMPEIVKTYNQQKDQNFVVISVDEQEDPGTVQKFVNDYKMDFPVVLDTSGQIGETYHAGTQFPTSVFISPDGTVRPIHNENGQIQRAAVAARQKDTRGRHNHPSTSAGEARAAFVGAVRPLPYDLQAADLRARGPAAAGHGGRGRADRRDLPAGAGRDPRGARRDGPVRAVSARPLRRLHHADA